MRFYVLRAKQLLWKTAAVLAVGVFLLAQGRPRVEPVDSAMRKLPIYSVETDKNELALGINCAWGNEDIPKILETLDQENVKATFFILGQWCEKYPESVRMIAQHGHEIASHGYSHDDMTAMGREELASQVQRGMDVLYGLCGSTPKLIRPPSGAYNDLVIETIEGLGYCPIQWDVDSLDWKGLSAVQIVERVAPKCRKGSIILLHSGAEHSADALPELLSRIRERGFSFVPVGELIYQEGYTIDATGRQCKK